MARKTPTRGQEATTGVANDPDSRTVRLKKLGGSQSDHWNTSLANQAARAMWVTNSDAAERDRQRSITAAALVGIAPTDVLEGMMAAQLLAAHNAAMECYRRAVIGDQTVEGRREHLNQANKLSRTWAMLLDTLNKHRGKGQQKVTVEHVHVHAGGQAVVGTIERPGGGDRRQSEEQPRAKQNVPARTPAPEPPLWSPDAARDAVPVTRDGERPVPDARGHIPRCSDR